jgi:biopolymer transport protein ExbD
VSSFSDIAFLLIIFFILVTSLEKFAGFKASLPAADKSKQTQSDTMPTVKLNNGMLFFNDEQVDMDALRGRLAARNLPGLGEEERIVIIEATGKVPYQQYYQVMAAISDAGGVVGIVKEE